MKFMNLLIITLLSTAAVSAYAKSVGFNFKDAEITDVIREYSKASGQKFIVDPSVRGKITIVNPAEISVEEAFNQLSTALATNSIGISKQGEVMLIQNSRQIQRNYIEVGTELPPLRPERMYTWVVNLKYANADKVNRELRILTSKDGELVPTSDTNQLLITDWVGNLHRIAKIIEQIDKPASKTKK